MSGRLWWLAPVVVRPNLAWQSVRMHSHTADAAAAAAASAPHTWVPRLVHRSTTNPALAGLILLAGPSCARPTMRLHLLPRTQRRWVLAAD